MCCRSCAAATAAGVRKGDHGARRARGIRQSAGSVASKGVARRREEDMRTSLLFALRNALQGMSNEEFRRTEVPAPVTALTETSKPGDKVVPGGCDPKGLNSLNSQRSGGRGTVNDYFPHSAHRKSAARASESHAPAPVASTMHRSDRLCVAYDVSRDEHWAEYLHGA